MNRKTKERFTSENQQLVVEEEDKYKKIRKRIYIALAIMAVFAMINLGFGNMFELVPMTKGKKYTKEISFVLNMIISYLLFINVERCTLEKIFLSLGFASGPYIINILKKGGNYELVKSGKKYTIKSKTKKASPSIPTKLPLNSEASFGSETIGNTSFGRMLWPK